MMRPSKGHTKSTPKLPSASSPTTSADQRQALATSISASFLRTQDAHPSQSTLPAFKITDLLPAGPELVRQTRKRPKPVGGGLNIYSNRCDAASPSMVFPLSPIQKTDPSDADSGNNSGDTALVTGPTSRVKIEGPSQSAAGQYVQNLRHAENTELFAYSSALCHRITGRYLPRDVLQRDPDAQKKEVIRIQRDPELVQAIAVIQTLSKQFKGIAQDTLGHRKELGHALFRIEASYLKLFEKLLEISLRMFWRYEREQDIQRRADKKTIQYWSDMHDWKASELERFQKLFAAKDVVVKTQKIQLDDLEKECSSIQHELSKHRAIEAEVLEQNRVEAESVLLSRQAEFDAEYARLQQKHEESIAYERTKLEELREQYKAAIGDMKQSMREKQQLLTRQEKAIHELTALTKPTEKINSETQTEVNDDGLWDTQDAVPRYVSKDVWHRVLWRRFDAFVRCKNCHGRPIHQHKSYTSVAQDGDQEYVDVWSLTRGERQTKKMIKRNQAIESEWKLPESVMLFLSNLPKTVVALRPYKLPHVIRQIEQIYDDKFFSDQVDEADGVAREELPKFLCEFFLKSHGLRENAEIGLYRFLISVKNTFMTNSHARLFARFCNLLHWEKPIADSSQKHTTKPQASSEETVSNDAKAVPQKSFRRAYLDRSFLRVFLHARHFLLRPPPPRPIKLDKRHSLHPATIPKIAQGTNHVVQVDAIRKWVPLEHGVTLIRWYLNFLNDELLISYCREVEYSTAIFTGRSLTEISGNRLAVRAEMRNAMLTGNEDEVNSLSEKERRVKPKIVVDVHRVLELLVHALEERQGGTERELIDMFDKGDVNHDCVLSLNEFQAIIRTRMPAFSDRRILRMFREALMSGNDQSFALSMDTFIQVCNDHGLAALLPDDRWQDPFESAQSIDFASPKQRLYQHAVVKKDAFPSKWNTNPNHSTTDHNKPKRIEANKEHIMHPALATVDAMEIPEELPPADLTSEDGAGILSPRANEVEDEEEWEW